MYKLFGITAREVFLSGAVVVLAMAAGWVATSFLPVEAYLRGGGVFSIPFFLLSALAIQLRSKQADLTAHAGLSPRELDRLSGIIEERNHRLNVLIIFYALSGLFVAMAPVLKDYAHAVSVAIIAVALIALAALAATLQGWSEFDRFRAKLDRKERASKERARLLDRMRHNGGEP